MEGEGWTCRGVLAACLFRDVVRIPGASLHVAARVVVHIAGHVVVNVALFVVVVGAHEVKNPRDAISLRILIRVPQFLYFVAVFVGGKAGHAEGY